VLLEFTQVGYADLQLRFVGTTAPLHCDCDDRRGIRHPEVFAVRF